MTRNQNKYEQGFTVTELLVVFLIMVLMAGLGIISWNQQTPRRNLTIAQNELITNIRKIQGYAVSSRNIDGVSSANYYVIRFERDTNSYEVMAIDSNGSISGVLETGTLPQGINFTNINLVNQSTGDISSPVCTFLIFNVIYAKAYLGGDANCSNNYLSNLVIDPPALARQANFNLVLGFTHTQTGQSKGVFLDGQSGRIQTYTPAAQKPDIDPKK